MKTANGFALAALMIFMMAASIVLLAVLPSYLTQARREMEEELIFRGQEYVRAIQKYKRRFGIYPSNIESLIETDGLPFLRREYRDPITGTAFRLLKLNQDGMINGSTVYSRRSVNTELAAEASLQINDQPTSNQSGTSEEKSERNNNIGDIQKGNIGLQGIQSAFASQFQGVVGSGIIGVASESDQQTLKVYNQRSQYNEWEFIAITDIATVEEGNRKPSALPLQLDQQNQSSPLPRM